MQSNSKSDDEIHFHHHTSSKPVTLPRPKTDPPKSASTPIANHMTKSSDLTIDEDLTSFVGSLHAEILGRVVGPVDMAAFNAFLPPVRDRHSKPDGNAAYEKLASRLENATVESDMYEPMVEYFNNLCPSQLNFRGKYDDVFNVQDINPDIIVYNKKKEVEAMFEVKYSDFDDPFDDNLTGFVTTSNRGAKTLGQITSYATCHQAMHLRTHAFSALIFRKHMRLLRWDRSGVVVTERISFDNIFLFDFFHRFSIATAAERGRDPTVTVAQLSPELKQNIRHQLNCRLKTPLLDVSVGNKNYIISEDQFPGPKSPVGYSTRYFKAFCLENDRLVLLKDSWRLVSPTLKPEHEIYGQLHEHKVPNIPEVYHGADVEQDDPYQTTQTKLWLSNTTRKPLELTLRTFRHYRIALEYLPFTLEEFKVVWELLAVTRDAAIAYDKAATSAKVLHHDISNGNIMFKRDQNGIQGYLIDWDFSLDLTLDVSKEARPERTGTWQFLAVRLLEKPKGREISIQNEIDDMESFFHLLTWMVLRYTAHSLSPDSLNQCLSMNFDSSYRDPDTSASYVTSTRLQTLMFGKLITDAKLANPAIVDILDNLRHLLSKRYTILPQNNIRDDDLAAEQGFLRNSRDSALKRLKQSVWLAKLLTDFLEDQRVDWETCKDRVNHELVKLPNFAPTRKAVYTQEGPLRYLSRISRTSTLQDERSSHN